MGRYRNRNNYRDNEYDDRGYMSRDRGYDNERNRYSSGGDRDRRYSESRGSSGGYSGMYPDRADAGGEYFGGGRNSVGYGQGYSDSNDYGQGMSDTYGGGFSSNRWNSGDDSEGGYGNYDRGRSQRGYGSGGYDRNQSDRNDRGSYGGRSDRGYGGYGGYSTGSYGGSDAYYNENYNDYPSSERGYFDNRNSYRGRDQDDRGWWDKTTDEVASWFGDDEARRRRRMDEQGEHRGRGPRNYTRSDDRIKEDINDRFTDSAFLDASDIEVEVDNGEVTLTGTVDSRYSKRMAEDIAESVSGVQNVENRIRYNQGSYNTRFESGDMDTSASSTSRQMSDKNTTTTSGSGTGSTGDTSTSTSSTARSKSAGSGR